MKNRCKKYLDAVDIAVEYVAWVRQNNEIPN